MTRLTLFAKLLCLFIAFSLSFAQKGNTQVLLHEGFEEDSTGWQIKNLTANKWDVLSGGFNSYKGDKCMYVTTNDYGAKTDCWLISAPVKFEAGKKYSISFYYKCQVAMDNSLELFIGNSSTPSSWNIIWKKTFNNDTYLKGQVNYVPVDTKTQSLGFRCTTKQMFSYMYLDEVTVQKVTCFEPLNISFSNIKSSSFTASWDKVDGAAFYEYSIFNKDSSVPKIIHKTVNNSVNITALLPATSGYFYVRSKCSDTDSSSWAIAKFATNYDCSKFQTINCGDTITKNYKGKTGIYPVVLCDQPLRGPEFFHKFTPTTNGYYKLDCYSAGGNGVLFGFGYKESSLGCGNSDWKCIGITVGGSAMVFGPLTAGQEYIIMEKSDLQPWLLSDYSFKIECYTPSPANDSCSNAINIPVSDYNNTCSGTALTTVGATPDIFSNDFSCGSFDGSNDDDIWVKFKATDNTQLFRFSNATFRSNARYLVVNFYSELCDANSLIDCGALIIPKNQYKDIVSYYFEKGKTYYCRISTFGIDNTASFNLCIMKPGIIKNPVDSCYKGTRLTLQYKDQNVWIPLLSDSLNITGAVNINSNDINNITPFVYINKNNLRKDANNAYYLNRNFRVTVNKQPASPVKVRLYFTNTELAKLIIQPGSHVTSIKDINVTQTDANCSSDFRGRGTLIIPYARGSYDDNTKYVEFTTGHLSSFFLHGGNAPLAEKSGVQSNASIASLKHSGIRFSPNPFTNILFIEATEATAVEYKFTVNTFNGKPVRSFVKKLSAGNNKIKLDLASLAAGVYILRIETPTGIEYSKIVKQ